MRRSMATVCVSGDLAQKLEAIAAAGFNAVEIFENDLVCFQGSPREVARIADGLGLEIALYQPFRDFEGVPKDVLGKNLERASRKFDLMNELGASMMLVCSNASPAAIEGEELAAEQLRLLAEKAATRGVKIGYEALAWGTHIRHVDQVARIVKAADHPHLGVLLDSFHMLALGDSVDVIRSIPGEKIFFVQIADAPLMKLDPMHWSRHYRCFPGQGQMNVAAFTDAILESGYHGPISLEVFNDEFRGGATRQIARDGMRSLLLLEEEVRRSREKRGDSAARGRKVALFDPPEPPPLSGISFLEFAVDEASQPELRGWLERFGFKRVGQHRSKAVELLRFGDVNLVLNAENDSFAHSYYLLHGVSLCAMGLRTSDAAAAMGRATAYNSPRYEGRVGPNELAIPAVRVPDGSLIYFVDEKVESAGLYEIEFVLSERQANESATSPKSVDHVAMALPVGSLDTWVLYWRSVLGLEAKDTFVIPDPHGMVRSKAMSDPTRSLRLPLNVSAGRETAAAQSVAHQVGAGVHHIAFGCDDLFGLEAKLRANKSPLLEMPKNYYDDLQARLGVTDAMRDKLERANILYDRSSDGEFLHFYSEFFRGRFFLEFVQRVGGYDDYGAPNAPVRMAAHARLRRTASIL